MALLIVFEVTGSGIYEKKELVTISSIQFRFRDIAPDLKIFCPVLKRKH